MSRWRRRRRESERWHSEHLLGNELPALLAADGERAHVRSVHLRLSRPRGVPLAGEVAVSALLHGVCARSPSSPLPVVSQLDCRAWIVAAAVLPELVMTLELFGWLLVAIGLVLLIYGYLKASKCLDVEEQSLPRVTEQEKREALRVASRVRLHDWEESGEL